MRVQAVIVSHPAKTLMRTPSSCADVGFCRGFGSEASTDSGRKRKSVFEADSSMLYSIHLPLRRSEFVTAMTVTPAGPTSEGTPLACSLPLRKPVHTSRSQKKIPYDSPKMIEGIPAISLCKQLHKDGALPFTRLFKKL